METCDVIERGDDWLIREIRIAGNTMREKVTFHPEHTVAFERLDGIERGDDWLLRDFTLRGEDMQERVTFEPEERVTFVRTRSNAMGTVMNEIVELDDGEMGLRFTFTLDVEGLDDGSAEEAEFAERMSRSYFEGVESTLAEIRRRVTAGELDKA